MLFAATWFLFTGLPRYERWQAGREIADTIQRMAPLRVMVEQWRDQHASCPKLSVLEGSHLDPRIRRVFLDQSFPPFCNIQIDLLPPRGRLGLIYPTGVHLILKEGAWLCLQRGGLEEGLIPGCRASAADLTDRPSGN